MGLRPSVHVNHCSIDGHGPPTIDCTDDGVDCKLFFSQVFFQKGMNYELKVMESMQKFD